MKQTHTLSLVLIYWAICAILGAIFLQDWITSWHVQATFARPWLIAFLIITWLVSQSIYIVVADHHGRPLNISSTILFAIGNGVFETFAFAVVYRAGEYSVSWLIGMIFPHAASVGGFLGGTLLLMTYNGPLHMLFWMKILPPHASDTPLAKRLHPYMVPSLGTLVVGWCLCFWLTNDIWTPIISHTLVDAVLMIRVRPSLRSRTRVQ